MKKHVGNVQMVYYYECTITLFEEIQKKLLGRSFMLTQLPEAREKEKSKTGFGQVKIMKEFV